MTEEETPIGEASGSDEGDFIDNEGVGQKNARNQVKKVQQKPQVKNRPVLKDPISAHRNHVEAKLGKKTVYVPLDRWLKAVAFYARYRIHLKPLRANVGGVLFEPKGYDIGKGRSYRRWKPTSWLEQPTNLIRLRDEMRKIVDNKPSKSWMDIEKDLNELIKKPMTTPATQRLRERLQRVFADAQKQIKDNKKRAQIKKLFDVTMATVRGMGSDIKKRVHRVDVVATSRHGRSRPSGDRRPRPRQILPRSK